MNANKELMAGFAAPQGISDPFFWLIPAGVTMEPEVKQRYEERVAVEKYKRFLPIAAAYASLSKDKSTKVGALIIGPAFEVRSAGWNGAPRGCNADEDSRFETRPEKYLWASHGESNAIANAARCGTPIDGCTMVITLAPCMDCAKLIVQAGIKRVVCPVPGAAHLERWGDQMLTSRRLFQECGVDYVETGEEQ